MSTLADARVAAQHDLSRALASARKVGEAAPAILAAISKHLGCVVSEMWVVSETSDILQSIATWSSNDTYAPFLATDERLEFTRGRGLPGLAWERVAPQWMEDVSTDASFERKLAAVGAGLHGAVAFPIVYGGEVTGVVQFFYAEQRSPDDVLVRTFADVGEQIGLFLERARVDAKALQQAAEILELSAPILRVAPRALLLPIIGTLDARRAVHVTERLLSRIVEASARFVVLDFTSAGAMDTFMAQRVLDTITAVRLLGAQTIVTGLGAETARTLALLGIDVRALDVCSSLAEGLERVRPVQRRDL